MKQLLNVSLRQQAVFIPTSAYVKDESKALTENAGILITNLAKLGFGVTEDLLQAMNRTDDTYLQAVLEMIREVMGVNKNWTPLVKGWDVPTGEGLIDHIITLFANVFQTKGERLACGHIIPPNTFPLERYNGCPFCGTPFAHGEIEVMGQGSKLKILSLWKEEEASAFLANLLQSKTALDATQIDSLKLLLEVMPVPEVKIGMKETQMVVIDAYFTQNKGEKAQAFFSTPQDILRFLWYKHTGFLQLVEPATIVKRKAANNRNRHRLQDKSAKTKVAAKEELKLKYGRKECATVAKWLNALAMTPEKACEIMHPKRSMWVRFIRALRLAEYSKKPGFENLARLMDVFYNETYTVWQGEVNRFRMKADADAALALLQQRPGLFARSLFSSMLWFGPEKTVAAFEEIVHLVPARLVFTLNMYAENYFQQKGYRTVKPLGGVSKSVPPNPLLKKYNTAKLDAMKAQIETLCLLAMKKRFLAVKNPHTTMFIDPALFKIPVSIGDRSENVQDLPSALMGSRFEVQGNAIRLFMQWGTGLPAQHLDMDLSCHIAYDKKSEVCAFHNLVTKGCKHSGDIRSIPTNIGTAEYIEINLDELTAAKAKYVTFTCNAYSSGNISPNLVLGWMDSKHPMKVSETTGVAYDPSCVIHQVRITQKLTKGLVFGVLEVETREIIWLEMPFQGQVVGNLDVRSVELLMKKLNSKLSIGNLLTIKAEAQQMQVVSTPEADEVYTLEWARDTAAVTALLVD